MPWYAAATTLLGLPGLVVTAVTETGDGWTVVDVVTGPEEEQVRRCPGCGTAAAKVKDRVTTAPRDVRVGDRQVLLRWHKTCWFSGLVPLDGAPVELTQQRCGPR